MFAILVLMALFTTFMTTPAVMAIYRPARNASSHPSHTGHQLQRPPSPSSNSKNEFRVLACVHGPRNVPSLINLLESTGTTTKSSLKLYVMHLVELTERPSSIMMVHRARKNGFPFINRFHRGKPHNQVAAAFEAYSQLSQITVRPITGISALSSMHEDICHVAEKKRVSMIILPFHKHWSGEGDEAMENVGHDWQRVNQRVQKSAPCTVVVFVDRGFEQRPRPTPQVAKRVCILFFGGPDDREALEFGGRMADQPAVRVTLVRFIGTPAQEKHGISLQPSTDMCTEISYSSTTARMSHEHEKELDENAVAEFRRRWEGLVGYIEEVTSNVVEGALTIGQSGEYELLVVGRFLSTVVAVMAGRKAENVELGPIGDILASSDHGISSSVLVIQHHNLTQAQEAPA